MRLKSDTRAPQEQPKTPEESTGSYPRVPRAAPKTPEPRPMGPCRGQEPFKGIRYEGAHLFLLTLVAPSLCLQSIMFIAFLGRNSLLNSFTLLNERPHINTSDILFFCGTPRTIHNAADFKRQINNNSNSMVVGRGRARATFWSAWGPIYGPRRRACQGLLMGAGLDKIEKTNVEAM